MPAYSVLMSVYNGEKPDFLRLSIQSMLNQTQPPDEFILVCDGPLTDELNAVVTQSYEEAPAVLHIVRLLNNSGISVALNEGMKRCKNEWIARMDSDDIAYPNRCERQLAFVEQQGLDVVSATVEEFNGDICHVTGKRMLPATHTEIELYAHKRNPMNHPSILYRKSSVQVVDGYRELPGFEDYDLWVRMMQSGARMGNIQEPLLYMRAGRNIYRRRGGWHYCKAIVWFWREMKRIGFVTNSECVVNTVLRCTVSLLPRGVRQYIYQKQLRAT